MTMGYLYRLPQPNDPVRSLPRERSEVAACNFHARTLSDPPCPPMSSSFQRAS